MSTERPAPVARTVPAAVKHFNWRLASAELIQEIVAAAEAVSAARTFDGDPVFRTDAVWLLLSALERAKHCCSISDAARLLRMSRQRVQRAAHEAEIRGAVELAPNPDDARIVQVLLTRHGRAELAAARSIETPWLNVLLNGLDEHRMETTLQVVRVIRQRLQRDERERRARR
jgi:DNA-binding MarR family transcriptional regulator